VTDEQLHAEWSVTLEDLTYRKNRGRKRATVTMPNGEVHLIISKSGRFVQVFSGARFIGEFSVRQRDTR